jgi:hypothetical protein
MRTATGAAYLPELPEDQATGEVKHIYEEIRRLAGVPMAALVFRHLATLPGALEWAWGAIGPAMQAGRIQERAWRIAREAHIDPIVPMPRAALHALGVDDEALDRIHAVVDSYNRANPVNLLAITCLTKIADGSRAGRKPAKPAALPWTPPLAHGALPAMIDIARMPAKVRDLLAILASPSTKGDTPIVPSLYRHFGAHPHFLALVVTLLLPRFEDGAIARSVAATRAAMDEAANEVTRGLAAPKAPHAEVAVAFERFTPLIPEMIAVGSLLKRALPPLRGAPE